MNPSRSARSRICVLLALCPLLLAGCTVVLPLTAYQDAVRYVPVRAPATVPAAASVEVRHSMSPELRQFWVKLLNAEENVVNYVTAMKEMLARDLSESGLFTTSVPSGAPADYRLLLEVHETKAGDFFDWQLKLSLQDAKGGVTLFSRSVNHRWPKQDSQVQWKETMPRLMAVLKEGVVAYWTADQQAKAKRDEERTVQTFATLKLADLLASSDPTVLSARERNRAIIAAKNTQLDALLRESRTSALTALIVTIEQTILDLNHEAEVTKDRAQQAAATAPAGDNSLEQWRGLAISYRERIELLKPILAAVRQEVAQRNR